MRKNLIENHFFPRSSQKEEADVFLLSRFHSTCFIHSLDELFSLVEDVVDFQVSEERAQKRGVVLLKEALGHGHKVTALFERILDELNEREKEIWNTSFLHHSMHRLLYYVENLAKVDFRDPKWLFVIAKIAGQKEALTQLKSAFYHPV